ncbi:recombinase family protein [bacterium]|nr:recombinase family protein [bacterium]
MSNQKCICYYRVSTQAQGISGLGLEAQRASVQRFLAGGQWEQLGEYTDVESGRKSNRPELLKAIAHAKRSNATLIIAKLDRLARNVAFIANLMESRIDFIAVDNPHANKLTIQILAVVAEAEAEMISARTKAALQAAKARGVKLGKPENLTADAIAKGVQAARDVSIARAKEAYSHLLPIVRNARDQGQTFVQIAELLNQQGERTRKGALFQSATVQRILKRA